VIYQKRLDELCHTYCALQRDRKHAAKTGDWALVGRIDELNRANTAEISQLRARLGLPPMIDL